ncbi:MAG: STAS domain-containing protein [Spirochaetes bacterium]|nr:STAS domain-containing protein [Spirochaetota bacterium]
MQFHITQIPADNIENEIYTISLSGELAFDNHRKLSAAFSELIQKGGRKIIIDFHDLFTLDSGGIGLLIKFQKELLKENGEIVIARCNDQILTLLLPINIHKLIKIFDTIDDAVNHFTAS